MSKYAMITIRGRQVPSAAERLVNLMSVFCILSWRVFWMTMINRTAPNAPPEVALPIRTHAASRIDGFDELLDAAAARAPEHHLVEIASFSNLAAFLSVTPLTGSRGG
jgi:hypothetical protein